MISIAMVRNAGCFDPNASFLHRVLSAFESNGFVTKRASFLVVFGGEYDQRVFEALQYRNVSFTNITPSQVGTAKVNSVDASSLPFPNASRDFVIAHAGIHHASRPHAAVCEMYRVARRGVVFVESQDSLVMQLAVRAGLVPEYEWNAIFDHGMKRGGVDDRPIPNYVYRWTRREVEKLVRALEPEREPVLHFLSEWDFYYGRIARRLKATPLRLLPDSVMQAVFAASVRLANATVGRFGNAFAVGIEKGGPLKPWIRRREGRLEFDPRAVRAPVEA